MKVVVCPSAPAAGSFAAAEVAARLNGVLAERERARLLLSTGESQFDTLRSLVRRSVDWRRVDGFHLDEYVGLDAGHPASFRRYLAERVAGLVPIAMHYVDPGSPQALEELTELLTAAPVDVALVGIGENGHLAFNDPPADLETPAPYLEVALDAACRAQQVREGWFAGLDDVPERALTMSVRQILSADRIVSVVPHAVKAPVIARLLASTEVTPELPATALRTHHDVTVVLDTSSAQLLPTETWNRCVVL